MLVHRAREPGSLNATLGSVDVSMGAVPGLVRPSSRPTDHPHQLSRRDAGVPRNRRRKNYQCREWRVASGAHVQVLTDIVVSNNRCYQVCFNTAANFSKNKVAGVYPPTGQPFQIITVENPETNTVNKLRLSTTGALGEREYQYEYFSADNCWELTRVGGLVKESRAAHWVGDVRIETNEVHHAVGTHVAKQVEKYRVFPVMRPICSNPLWIQPVRR